VGKHEGPAPQIRVEETKEEEITQITKPVQAGASPKSPVPSASQTGKDPAPFTTQTGACSTCGKSDYYCKCKTKTTTKPDSGGKVNGKWPDSF
jgi:hypothetical protein